MPPEPAPPAPTESLSTYHRWLFFFLGVAGFFEGYDTFALSQILPSLRADMNLSKPEAGNLLGFINIGLCLSYVLVRWADRWGRRRVLTITILGYTASTLLTGLAPNVLWFGVCQLAARLFLGAEWAVSTVYAAEEFPAARRGTLIGIIHGVNALGAVICAGIAPALCGARFGWRTVYFVGALPLLLIALSRRSLRETRRFSEQVKSDAPAPFTRILAPPWRRKMLIVAAIWALTYACATCAVAFWKDFAITERGQSDERVGATIAMAAVLAVPLAFGAGRLIDHVGRRRGAVVIYALTILGTIGCYNLDARALVVASLVAAIAGITGVGVVMAAYNVELFPTDLRGDAFGWSNSLLGRAGVLVSPPLVGALAGRFGWGLSVSLSAVCPAVGLLLILWLLPETSGRELEETSREVA